MSDLRDDHSNLAARLFKHQLVRKVREPKWLRTEDDDDDRGNACEPASVSQTRTRAAEKSISPAMFARLKDVLGVGRPPSVATN